MTAGQILAFFGGINVMLSVWLLIDLICTYQQRRKDEKLLLQHQLQSIEEKISKINKKKGSK